MRTVRVRLVPHIHPHVEAKTELLSLHRCGWVSTAARAGLYESANQTRLSGSVCVERDDPASGRSGADPSRNRSSPRGRTKSGPLAQARRGIASGTDSRGEKQRAPGDSLPGGIADAFPTTAKDAAIAETNAGRRVGITISEDGCGGRSKIPATGREPGGIPQQVADTSRGAGYRSTTTDSTTAGEGSSGGERHDCPAPFDPDSTIRARVKRITGPIFRRHSINAEPRLSFAFGESFRRPAACPSSIFQSKNDHESGF